MTNAQLGSTSHSLSHRNLIFDTTMDNWIPPTDGLHGSEGSSRIPHALPRNMIECQSVRTLHPLILDTTKGMATSLQHRSNGCPPIGSPR